MPTKLLCERTGFDHKTVNKVFTGDLGVAIGTYLKVMAIRSTYQDSTHKTHQNWVLSQKFQSSSLPLGPLAMLIVCFVMNG